MRTLVILSIAAAFYGISSCCGCDGKTEESGHIQDSVMHDSVPDVAAVDTAFVDTAGYVNDSLEAASEIEKIYGEQWEFCDCVVKNDSVNKALETASDDQIDAILTRMDVIDQHCKNMLTQPNTTPEQRDRHARKVRKCLKEAGVL